MESYAKGETEPALLDETIGANFETTATGTATHTLRRDEVGGSTRTGRRSALTTVGSSCGVPRSLRTVAGAQPKTVLTSIHGSVRVRLVNGTP